MEVKSLILIDIKQVELTPVVFVGSLMPRNPLRGLVAVVTRGGIWESDEQPTSIWGFSLTGKGTNFRASKFEGFEISPTRRTVIDHQNVPAVVAPLNATTKSTDMRDVNPFKWFLDNLDGISFGVVNLKILRYLPVTLDGSNIDPAVRQASLHPTDLLRK